MSAHMTGAKMVVKALIDQGVDTVFGYPGGAVLPIYDEIFQQNSIRKLGICVAFCGLQSGNVIALIH